MRENRDKEKQLVKRDFDLLIEKGNLGFYNSCEITTIFLYDNTIKKAKNFYTIVVFEEREKSISNEKSFITNKPINIDKQYRLGIIRYQRTIEELEKDFIVLLRENKWAYDENDLIIGNLKPLPKQFIPKDGTETVPLNSVLKNNFYNGSYVLEFFDQEKQELRDVLESDKLLGKICKCVTELLPIDLLYIRDRIGNIIFQFPSMMLTLDTKPLSSWEGMEAQIAWHPFFNDLDKISIQTSSHFDNNIMGFYQLDQINHNSNELYTGNSNDMNDTIIFNKENGLILSCFSASFMKDIHISGYISSAFQEARIIKSFDKDDNLVKNIEIPIVYSTGRDKPHKMDHSDWISNRIYENEKKRLERDLIFVQYGNKTNDRNKALEDLRTLIGRHGEDGIYLWDPYLSYRDILDTIYYYEVAGVPMRAINSYKKQKNLNGKKEISKDKKTYRTWVENQIKNFELCSNHLGIDLELRCQHDQYGWPFHDRFIIFPLRDRRPRAWSLGTSINSFGKEHHILQEVGNAKMILDAFMELWEELQDPECLVWRSK
ncbi:VPA1262 family N-terminal domain-containing protein [Clostridium sp. Cult3]|uniref:VPA1262 family N-terminal domain-containing protein n=1 Tax=Clostridium sp. Cult3 TaxID=2079004 RepID=UPI001EEF17C1|nr:VPA1262 family N-terminal domain-containing protein [Clostridium sp. Cult3]MCF6459523.1 hypothetical protein [Clostridium sp. Cult3]